MDLALLFTQLIRIDGLDIWEGLSYVGCSREVYADALRIACVELEKKTAPVPGLMENGSWKEYTMTFHAVKGALAGVGAWELSASALELERASRNGDYVRCRVATDAVLEGVHALLSALRGTILFTKEEQRREKADLSFLVEKLVLLEQACSTGSSDEADSLGKELAAKTFDEETDTFVETICSHIENLDYELVLEAIKGWNSATGGNHGRS